jgi:hypothetical protein
LVVDPAALVHGFPCPPPLLPLLPLTFWHGCGFGCCCPQPPLVPSLFELAAELALALVFGLASAQPVVPPLPELPDCGFEFTVAFPVLPVEPVLPELPDLADESELHTSAMQGATFTAGPVEPEFPELPELPDVAVFPFDEASPVFPELAFPEVAEVSE